MNTVTDDRFEELEAGTDELWADLTASVQGAYDAVMPTPKP